MAYLVNFDSTSHTAFACSSNDSHLMGDAMSFFNDRIFSTVTAMEKCPEVQAYRAYFQAALATYRFNNETVYNQLMAEAKAWKQSAIDNQVKLDDGTWLVDDGNGDIFYEFNSKYVTVDTEDFCGYIRTVIATDSHRKTFLATNITVDLGIIIITVDNGDKIYLRLPKE